MGTATLTPPSTAAKAERLITASERASYDPFTEIDWSYPLDDEHGFYLPPEFLPLYGTSVWEQMTPTQRVEYSRHECASLCASGIWFENILMHLVLKHLYDLPPDDVAHRYLLIETADECRHSAMFGELIRRSGTPGYQVPPVLRFLGKYMKATTRGPEGYVAILAAEELLDISNRATMKDERVHPTSRHVAKIHVLEEARHMSFAKSYIADTWPTLGRFRRLWAQIRAPFVVAGIADALANPAVYDTLGIEGGRRVAMHNPHHRDRVVRDLERLTGFLAEVGVINRWNRPLWKALRLVG